MAPDTISPDRAEELKIIIEELEDLNQEAMTHNLWIRTRWNSANQKPWHLSDSSQPEIGEYGLPLANPKATPYVWKWKLYEPYLRKLADLCPLELTERQSVLLTNPSYPTGYKVTNTIRIAISIYKTGDDAVSHMHTPNATRTILTKTGGYTVVEGESMPAHRGDLIITPNGTWHEHGNHDEESVIWADTLDWPLMDFLGCITVRNDPENASSNFGPNYGPDRGFSKTFYGGGGMVPKFHAFDRGVGQDVTEMFYFSGSDIRENLVGLKHLDGSPYEGIIVEFVNPTNGHPIFPTLSYKAQLIRPGEETQEFRETSNSVYCAIAGQGTSTVDGIELEWQESDFFVAPGSSWRKHKNTGTEDAILYSYNDAPLMRAVGQYYAQGKSKAGTVEELT